MESTNLDRFGEIDLISSESGLTAFFQTWALSNKGQLGIEQSYESLSQSSIFQLFLNRVLGPYAPKNSEANIVLLEALVHRSIFYEYANCFSNHQERYEFLGDAIVNLYLAQRLFENFPQDPEGKLTRMRSNLSNGKALSQMALMLGLENFVLLGKGEINRGGQFNPNILADTFEALVGALYIVTGQNNVFNFLDDVFLRAQKSHLVDFVFGEEITDPKSRLQEVCLKSNATLPVYKEIITEREYSVVEIWFKEELLATETGVSKRLAEERAAISAIKKLKNILDQNELI